MGADNTLGTADDEVVLQNEGTFYLQVTNGCIKNNGAAVEPKSIANIAYWIKDTATSATNHAVSLFVDYPTKNFYTAQNSGA